MTVIVYAWRFRKAGLFGFGNVGHAALEVRDPNGINDCYLSWWPGGDVRRGRSWVVNKKLKHTVGHYMNFGYGTWTGHAARAEAGQAGWTAEQAGNLESDKEREGRSADAKYLFNLHGPKVLNELRIKGFVDGLHRGAQVLSSNGHAAGGEYSLVHANCSDAVATALQAGGAAQLHPKPAMRHFWTPTDVARWCDHMVIAANDKTPGSATRKRGFTGNDLDFTPKSWQFSALST